MSRFFPGILAANPKALEALNAIPQHYGHDVTIEATEKSLLENLTYLREFQGRLALAALNRGDEYEFPDSVVGAINNGREYLLKEPERALAALAKVPFQDVYTITLVWSEASDLENSLISVRELDKLIKEAVILQDLYGSGVYKKTKILFDAPGEVREQEVYIYPGCHLGADNYGLQGLWEEKFREYRAGTSPRIWYTRDASDGMKRTLRHALALRC
jgi:hypothetical protein